MHQKDFDVCVSYHVHQFSFGSCIDSKYSPQAVCIHTVVEEHPFGYYFHAKFGQ
jgi:hypothetical protein